MKKALTSIIAAAALVALVIPAAQATLDRSLPTKSSHAKVVKVAKHKVAVPAKTKGKTTGKGAGRPLIIIGTPVPGYVQPASADECVYSGNNCTDQQLCDIWGMNCDQVGTSSNDSTSSLPAPAADDSAGTATAPLAETSTDSSSAAPAAPVDSTVYSTDQDDEDC